MTLDVSLEAIEAHLNLADRGGEVARNALARAQVLATLLAAQPPDHQGRHEAPAATPPTQTNYTGPDIVISQGSESDAYTVPHASPWQDRVTAAALLLRIEREHLDAALRIEGAERIGIAMDVDDGALEDAFTEAGGELEDLDDVFAEARKARKKPKK